MRLQEHLKEGETTPSGDAPKMLVVSAGTEESNRLWNA